MFFRGLVPHAKIPVAKGYQVQFAEQIRAEATVATGAVGSITDPGEAEEVLQKRKGRPGSAGQRIPWISPCFPFEAAKELEEESWADYYARAKSQK